MKRFLAFQYDDYYPSGGANDFVRDFDTLDEAKALTTRHGNNLDVLDVVAGEWHEFTRNKGEWRTAA